VNAPRANALAFVATVLAAVLGTGCASRGTAPTAQGGRSLIVLLPQSEGEPASLVTVSNAAGRIELREPFHSTEVAGSVAPPPPAALAEADVEREFGDLLATLPAAPQRYQLYFRLDSPELTDESRALVPMVLKAVADRPVPDVTVIGHTDTTGNSASNYRLGLARAGTVRDLLADVGLDPAMVEVQSHGETDLLVSTPDGTAEPRNRRVEITVK
jgi:outer membrane protein OmpA-like peptidoglycan-associated protein